MVSAPGKLPPELQQFANMLLKNVSLSLFQENKDIETGIVMQDEQEGMAVQEQMMGAQQQMQGDPMAQGLEQQPMQPQM